MANWAEIKQCLGCVQRRSAELFFSEKNYSAVRLESTVITEMADGLAGLFNLFGIASNAGAGGGG